jgi:hypothetical protein
MPKDRLRESLRKCQKQAKRNAEEIPKNMLRERLRKCQGKARLREKLRIFAKKHSKRKVEG